ncbi:Eukaryotic porin/Tom40 [Arabidopsis thaliana x Arabidopsis arenosa]|uniref:Eukaryotic porin/Tom40 n=1 Tax=Arabidopsis thaliana x Arabidopsis arenosa TaxID=1240361 RepID=A0A8T2BZN7_9BRAS|nr:Eukaryotic porin/Tom40 [Arabidopsis thaliana x Arabidopsis arenosa]
MADILPPVTTKEAFEKVDNSNLTRPVGYHFVDNEANDLLKRGYFRGLNLYYYPAFFDEKLHISARTEPEHYELGASYYFHPKLQFSGYVNTYGGLTAVVYARTDNLIIVAGTELRNARLYMAGAGFEYLALNYRAQLELSSERDIGVFRASYIHRVTPRLSLGGEFYRTSVYQKLGVGYAARYETDKMVASAKVGSDGDVLMTYVRKISKKVSLATDFEYSIFSRDDVIASVGYECKISKQSIVQGKIDSNGVVSAFLRKRLTMGLECLLSASLGRKNRDRKLGLSLIYG